MDKETTDEIREIFSELIEENEIQELEKKRKNSLANPVMYAELFLICRDYVERNLSLLDEEEIKEIKKLFIDDDEKLKEFLQDYNSGIHVYFTQGKIMDFIKINKQKMEELVDFFFRTFKEND